MSQAEKAAQVEEFVAMQRAGREPAWMVDMSVPCVCGAEWEKDGSGYSRDHFMDCTWTEAQDMHDAEVELVEFLAAQCEEKGHDYMAARVGTNLGWWQCSRCGHLAPREVHA